MGYPYQMGGSSYGTGLVNFALPVVGQPRHVPRGPRAPRTPCAAAGSLFVVTVGWKPMYRPFRHPVNLQLARQKIKNRQPLFRVTFTRPLLDRQPVYGLTVGLRSVEVPGGVRSFDLCIFSRRVPVTPGVKT